MRLQAAATTPYRRSQLELLSTLNDLFDSLPGGSRPTSPLLSLPDGHENAPPRSAPLRLLPELFAAFEKKRGVQILSTADSLQLQELVNTTPEEAKDIPVGVQQVLGLLIQLGLTSESSSSASEADEPPRQPSPTFTRQRPASPLQQRRTMTGADGSPLPRHRRTTSNSSLTSLSSTASSSGPPGSSAASASALGGRSTTPTGTPAARRRSLMSSLSRSSPSHPGGGGLSATSTPGRPNSLRKRRTFEDLSALVVQQGGTYLGVGMDGPTGEGEGWSAEEVAERARGIVAAKVLNRDRDLALLLAPLTHPQLKALDQAYSAAQGGNGRSLLDVVTAEKAFKGNVDFALRGLLMGPLGWDVWLLQKALEGVSTNDTLLIDLLISRTPSDLALLRTAYSLRNSARTASSTSSTTPTSSPAPSASSSRSLDVAVLSAHSSNVRLRKAWEVALQGRWEDYPDGGEEDSAEGETEAQREEREEKRRKLFREDLDQLKVALRRGGNVEIVAKILLARSPSHLHALTAEYRKSTSGHSSLPKAIKQCIPVGPLQALFLHAVEGAKNAFPGGGEGGKGDGLAVGVWRDAKAVERAVEVEKGGKREELLWRLIRLHWDRPRFLAVQQAYKQKYRKPLADRLAAALPAGAISDLASGLVKSASLPEPTPSSEDQQRLDQQAPPPRSRASSVSSLASMPEEREPDLATSPTAGGESGYESAGSASSTPANESAELEAEGELSDPPSPRSPPGQPQGEDQELDFPMDDAEPFDRESTPSLGSFTGGSGETTPAPDTPTLPASEQGRRASVDGSSKGHVKSSSLSFRQRSAPLDLAGHRPPSSAGGSADSSKLSSSLRHSRPIAPSRAKRRQSEEPNRSRGDSEEPLSPGGVGGMRSPTPSSGSRASLSRSTSSSTGESLSSSVGSNRSVPTADDTFFSSPSTSIDNTSYHAAPLSPHQPAAHSSSSFFPGSSPPDSPRPGSFSLSGSAHDLFGPSDHGAEPDSPEKYFTHLRRQGSTVSHLSSTSSGGDGRPVSLFAGEGGLGLPESILANSPAGHSRDSSGSMFGSNEQVQQLLRHANDLMRKLKETEGRLQASASAYEEQVSDLETRLDEARSELQAKRREEKELRNIEKEHLVQINSLEADVARLTKSLEKSREAYDNMKRNYTSACEESERLRALVAETRRENRAAEEAIQNHALQVQQFERDRDLLQQHINKLEADLNIARQAQDSLDDQKQENLLLKETIDKLRFEIDEMRSNARKSQFLDSSVSPASPAKSLAESLSRSLGREISSQLAAQEDSESESDEGEETAGEDEVDDIIVTTHRRIKKRSKRSSPVSEPVVTHVETSINVSDADVQTEKPSVQEIDVQTDLSAVKIDLIAAPAVEPEVVVVAPPPKTERELQQDLAKELGVDVDLVQQYVTAKKNGKAAQLLADAVTPPLASPRRSGRWRHRIPMAHAPSVLVNAFPTSARPYVAQVLDSSISFFLYTATIYLVGVVSGSRFFPTNHHHTFAPFQVMFSAQDSTAYNTVNWEGLAPGSSSSGLAPEGLGHFLYELVWSGVRTARRIPV
ncbi:hypothetical protein JCM8097_005162 [Rhodosporidiobolus ruineniae]